MLGTLAFVMSICWLNLEANECIAILEAFGLIFDIDTGESLTLSHLKICVQLNTSLLSAF